MLSCLHDLLEHREPLRGIRGRKDANLLFKKVFFFFFIQ